MPAIDEDDRPKKKIAHEIGQDLDAALGRRARPSASRCCKDEIARLEADMAEKQASRSAADQFFKK